MRIFFIVFIIDTAKVSQIMLLIWVFITLQFIINLIPCIAVAILHLLAIDVISTHNQRFALSIQSVTSNQQTP